MKISTVLRSVLVRTSVDLALRSTSEYVLLGECSHSCARTYSYVQTRNTSWKDYFRNKLWTKTLSLTVENMKRKCWHFAVYLYDYHQKSKMNDESCQAIIMPWDQLFSVWYQRAPFVNQTHVFQLINNKLIKIQSQLMTCNKRMHA